MVKAPRVTYKIEWKNDESCKRVICLVFICVKDMNFSSIQQWWIFFIFFSFVFLFLLSSLTLWWSHEFVLWINLFIKITDKYSFHSHQNMKKKKRKNIVCENEMKWIESYLFIKVNESSRARACQANSIKMRMRWNFYDKIVST